MFAEAVFFLLTGIPLLLAMLVLLPVTQGGGVPAGFGVALGVGITTVGVALAFAARSLGRDSPAVRRAVIAVQVVLLAFALVSVPLHLVDVWPVWLAVVFAASLVLYALLVHPRLSAVVPQHNEKASPVAKRSAWATIGQVIGVSAAIVVILVLAAMALLTAVLVIVLGGLAKSG